MQCSDCGYLPLNKKAKFCSECGAKLLVQSANSQGNQPDLTDSTATTQKRIISADDKNGNTESKKSKSEDEQATCEHPLRDQNANVDQEQQEKHEKEQKQSGTADQRRIFCPQTPSGMLFPDQGSSVDSDAVEDMQTQKSDADYHAQYDTPPQPTPISRSRNIASQNRLTVYFHAILSNDFKFDCNEDSIFINAGPPLSEWKFHALQLNVTRDLSEHGFLVEGSLETNKEMMSVSIPYKYVVFKKAKKNYKFEYIYKQDCDQAKTSRCLFVEPRLLIENGDWHQYDDIVCVKPKKTFTQHFTSFWSNQGKQLIEGRDIAGKIMMDRIFDLLRTWTDTNLKNFLKQLNQFFQIYANPSIYEGIRKKWNYFNYNENNLRTLMKDFMLTKVSPRVNGDENAKSLYIQDPLRAAVIMLHLCEQYRINLDPVHRLHLCTQLSLPKLDKSAFLQYWQDFSRDVRLLPSLPSCLSSLIKTVKQLGNPHWIVALPLFHLLEGIAAEPFQVLTSGHGLQDLEVGDLNSGQRKDLLNMIKKHHHLMVVDPLSARSGFYLMSLCEMKDYSIIMNIQLLDILRVLALKAPRDINLNNVQDLSDILSHIQKNLLETKYSCISKDYGRLCLIAVGNLFEKICNGTKSLYCNNIPLACMSVVASVFDLVIPHMQQEARGDGQQPQAGEIAKAIRIMRGWMSSHFKEDLLSRRQLHEVVATEAMEVWNRILGIRFIDNECQELWRLKLSLDFEGKYKKANPVDQIHFYCSKIEELDESFRHVGPTIEMCALEAVPSVCQTNSVGQLLKNFKMNGKFVKLVSAIVTNSWPRDHQGNYEEKKETVLQYLLSWTAAGQIFQLYGAEENLFDKLTDDARDRITFAVSTLRNIKNQLIKGNITVKLLRILLASREALLELLKIDCLSENEQHRDTGKMTRLLKCRESEVQAVYTQKEQVDSLLTMIRHLDEDMAVDVRDMEERCRVNIEMMALDLFMEVHPFDQLPSATAGVVTYFKINDEIRQMSDVLYKLNDSHIFILCWKEQGKLLGREDVMQDNPVEEDVPRATLTLNEIHADIFKPCVAAYTDIYTHLKNGSIKLKEVQRLFTNYRGKYAQLARDLDIMCRIDMSTDKQWIHTRLQQIEQYHELHLAVDSAEVIMAVKGTLCLEGDFSVLETLLKVSHADFEVSELQCIDNDLIGAKRDLADITEPRRLCLKELTRRGHFIKWVKDALKDLKELKVFVELASISAGENDMEVDRVACFHDAILGYSPVLYELHPDSGFLAFKNVLKKLWRALDKDNNLPKKMRDSGRHLEWLKTVKDSHGSVELSSMSLASAINSKGIYWISAQSGKKVSLDTTLKLEILEDKEDKEECETRYYSLEDVRELQNKLMLMSGKGDQGQKEMNYFTEVFAGVQRLAEAFIALYAAGNPLFRHWEAQIQCCSSEKLSIVMDFNLGENFNLVTIEERLPDLCMKMENILHFWLDYLDKQRSQHHFLNYFTAEQIFYLCSNLSEEHVKHVADQVLMMLSFIKPHCTASDVSGVWHELQNEILTKPKEQIEELEFQLMSDPSMELDPEEQANGFQRFDLIWNNYMKDPEDVVPHILDIQSLGRLLEMLVEKDDVSEEKVERELPKSIKAGNPNLIVCPHTAVLTSCISIYMTSKDQPLPTYDEVLLCNSSTTYEEVELFLRRCLRPGCKGKKIYCLLYGELLMYDVSCKVVKFFQRMKVQSSTDYRLVILCSSEREETYLPSAFSQYRLQIVPQTSLADIQRFLHQHYVVPPDQYSAAAVFKDRLCVGTVSSERAGVGKSLYIQRLYKKLNHSVEERPRMQCIRLIEPSVDEDAILQTLLNATKKKKLTVFHFDITSSVKKGIHEFLFKLLILRYLMDSEGNTWKCNDKDLYVMEFLEETVKPSKNVSAQYQDDTALDTTALVRSCVQSAVGMLRDQQGCSGRSTQRLETLLKLLSDSDQVTGDFLQIVKKRLYLILASESNFSSSTKDWVIKVASNVDALQEGGTFCHSLWKRIQAVVTPVLAQMVSVIDADRNLDILIRDDCSASVKRLWLHIFADESFLEIPQPSLDSKTRTILLRNYLAQGRAFTFSMPFSGRIKDYLEELWVHVLQNEGHTQQRFFEYFSKTPLGQYIAKDTPEMQSEFFQLYLQDFLFLTMNVTRQEDVQLLDMALNSCVNELRSQFGAMDAVPLLPWVHAAYHESKDRLQNLYIMVSLEPQVTADLLRRHQFSEGDELVLDVYAALACLEYLEPRLWEMDAQRQAWVRRVNKLKFPIELVCSEDSVRHYQDRRKTIVNRVRDQWNRIFSLSLFVEHFETQQREITPLIMKHVQLLNQALENNSDLKCQQPFEAMIRLLKTCKDEALKGIFRFSSVPWCLLCQGDPQDPISLPCEHIFCASCIKRCLVPCQMHVCPDCKQAVPDDFNPVPSEDLRIRVEQHALFRNQCNAFFIDLVSSVCFKDNAPPCPAVIHHLLSFLLVEASAAPILRADGQIRTKVLSPFDDSADKNPVVRSVVLKLLLKYSFDDVKDYLQHHLLAVEQCHILEERDKTKLYCLYLKCLQDSMFESFQFRSDTDKQACMRRETAFLMEVLRSLSPSAAEEAVVTVEHLQQVARLRMNLDLAATIIATEMPHGEGPSQSDDFLESVANLCNRSGNNWYRVYLVRKIISQRGVEFAFELLKMDDKHWLFPEEVLKKSGEPIIVEQYLVYGESYKKIRDAFAKAITEGRMDCLDKICQDCTTSPQRATVYLLLALHREVTTLFRNGSLLLHQNTEQFNTLLDFINTSKVLDNPKVKAFARVLVTNQPGPLAVTPETSGDCCASVVLAVHLAAVLLCTDQKIVAPLQHLAMEPATMQATFLPTMPQDRLAEAQQALANTREKITWYTCPNGHPCLVGECGRPTETKLCVDCKAPIGGERHVPVLGFNQLGTQTDRTQTGHILGDPSRRDNADMLDTKHLSPVPFTLIRMFTHLAMLIGASDHSQNISSIINSPVTEPGPFLLAHLKKDKEHFGRCLGKGTDDTVGAVHLLIRGLLEPQHPRSSDSWVLSTNMRRNEWEMQMSLSITPKLKHLDNQLKEVNASIQKDSQNSDNPIMWLLSDNAGLLMASLRTNSHLHNSAVWSCREQVSLRHLTHMVDLNDGKDTLPVLWRFLNKEAELRLVRHLPDIVSLQKGLLKQFLNVTQDSCGTIAEFLSSLTGSSRTWYGKHINTFLMTWNQLRSSLATYDEIKVPAEFCQRDLDSDSDLKFLLPQRHGPGLCSTVLVSYLIGLHNNMVKCVDDHTGEKTSHVVSPVDLTDLHVIHYEPQRDLMPLVLANTQYSIQRGQETLHKYDLPRIQKQIYSRFILGKPIIHLNGIPTLVNRPDRNYDIILKDVIEKVKQEPLVTQTMLAVAVALPDYSEACEALSTLEVALGFLAMSGGDPHMRLSSYLKDVLQMGSQISDSVLKVLSLCCLKHCVVLWQLLTALKSEIMLMLNRDPFEKVCEEYKQLLGEKERHLLTSFYSGCNTDTFLLELHKLLVLELKNPTAPDELKPYWSLISILDPSMEDKYPGLALDIHLSHCVETWKFINGIRRDRIRRQTV
ncbi:E3 ubiquitin-protein ligase rnf213-alpha isoform X4 [Phyllopteryx taeniolatus]|uniref:E3 ubiquitin-protein ligase rnf213-alpha isoform X4 n=1 Tax=Phyllopteryx taeniolatus TaxID=161469 RepID=UPI002AD5A97D|nr:E3 ubiquitin-protein ligase rnf213-alpha isoform X4 [Phyllopteryx taeniolatus]